MAGLRQRVSDLGRKVSDGLAVEMLRELLKQGLMYLGGFLLAFFLAGLGNFTLSLKSFDWFGWYNQVERPNQLITPDAVWKIPMGTVVRVRGGGFVTAGGLTYSGAEFVLRYTNGAVAKRANLAAGETMVIRENCRIRSFQPARPPASRDETEIMLIYTDQRDDDAGCRGWLERLLS